MEDESENFDELKKLLKLKRHEQPPPGFFRDLPGRVLQQIETEEAKAPGLWERLVGAFELRPALSTTFAGLMVGLLIVAVQRGQVADSNDASGSTLAIGDPVVEQGTVMVNNPFDQTNHHSLTSPPAGVFDPQLGPNVQRASATNSGVTPK